MSTNTEQDVHNACTADLRKPTPSDNNFIRFDGAGRVQPDTEYLHPIFENFPLELTSIEKWLIWKGKKIPYCPSAPLRKASVTDPKTWSDFSKARVAYQQGGVQGLSFVLDGTGLGGIDIDKCVHGGQPSYEAMQLLSRLNAAYIEYSPSGNGLRAFGYMEKIKSGRKGIYKGLNVEIYTDKRHLTVTGHIIKNEPLREFQDISAVLNAMLRPTEESEDTECNSCVPSVTSVPSVESFAQLPNSVIPFAVSQRNSKVFELARWTKGHYPDASETLLKEIFDKWWLRSLDTVGTKDRGLSWAEFKDALPKVRQPHGHALNEAFVASSAFAAPPAAQSYGKWGVILMKLCMSLQQRAGDAPFFLASRAAGDILQLHYTSVSTILRVFVADGLLVLIQLGKGHRASRYRVATNFPRATGDFDLKAEAVSNL